MKYLRILFFELLLFGILFVSCKDEIPSFSNSFSFEQTETLPDVSRLDPVALAFCRKHEQELLSSLNHPAVGIQPLIYPDQRKLDREELENINIVDSCGRSVSFFSLSENEQKEFLHEWTDFQAAQLTEKMALCPELREDLQAEAEENYSSLAEFLREDSIKKSHSSSYTPLSISDNTDYNVSPGIVISALSQYGRRGDLLIRKARENSSSPIDWNWHSMELRFGHVAILTQRVPSNATTKDSITVSANPEKRVHKEELSEWCTVCYLVGVQNVSYELRWFHLVKHCSPIWDPSSPATKAKSYMGHGYVYSAEFLTAKWAAPDRFTCATLAWWSAEKELNINISKKRTSCVSPRDILTNDHIYIKRAIRNQ